MVRKGCNEMKNALVIIILVIVIVVTIWLFRYPSAPDLLDVNTAQLNTPQWHLPKGVKARIGKGTVNDLAYSPDNTILAVASSTGTWFYDSNSGNELALLTKNREGTISVVFSPDGKILATVCGDKLVRLWNVESRELMHTFMLHWRVNIIFNFSIGVNFSPDGKTLICWNNHGMHFWDIEKSVYKMDLNVNLDRQSDFTFHADRTLVVNGSHKTIRYGDSETEMKKEINDAHKESITCVSFSPDGTMIASGSRDKTVRLWNAATETLHRTLKGHKKPILSLTFSRDGSHIASISEDKTIRVWHVATGRRKHTFKTNSKELQRISFSPDGETLASASLDGIIHQWDLNIGKHKNTIVGHGVFASKNIVFSKDKIIGATIYGKSNIILYDLNTQEVLTILTGHKKQVKSLSFSPDGKALASGGLDKTIWIWTVDTGEHEKTLRGHSDQVSHILFKDNETLISYGDDKMVRLWDIKKGRQENSLKLGVYSQDIGFSPDGNFALSQNYKKDQLFSFYLWDLETGSYTTLSKQVKYGIPFPAYIPISSDGSMLAYCTDSEIVVWDVTTSKQKKIIPEKPGWFSFLALNSEYKMLVKADIDGSIYLWNVDTGEEISILDNQYIIGGFDKDYIRKIVQLTLSPDGTLLVGGRFDGAINVWDVTTGKRIKTFNGHVGHVTYLKFSSDGQTLVSSGVDGTTLLWDLTVLSQRDNDENTELGN